MFSKEVTALFGRLGNGHEGNARIRVRTASVAVSSMRMSVMVYCVRSVVGRTRFPVPFQTAFFGWAEMVRMPFVSLC